MNAESPAGATQDRALQVKAELAFHSETSEMSLKGYGQRRDEVSFAFPASSVWGERNRLEGPGVEAGSPRRG